MQIFKTVLLLFSSLLTLASAGCFTSGADWGPNNKDKAIQDLQSVCDRLSGPYQGGQTKSQCRNGNGGIRFNFTVKKFTSGQQRLTKANCIDKLRKEITGCDKGGQSSYTDFEFT
jgi:hypothetical protein